MTGPISKPPYSKNNPENKPKLAKKAKSSSGIAIPTWPTLGDKTEEALFLAVGRAISEWEKADSVLGVLFSGLVSTHGPHSKEAVYSYTAIRTFEGRLALVRAASEAYFYSRIDTKLKAEIEKVLGDTQALCGYRNNIAHGVAGAFFKREDFEREFIDLIKEAGGYEPWIAGRTFCWMPGWLAEKRSFVGMPSYCYTAEIINKFSSLFSNITISLSEVARKVRVLNDAYTGKFLESLPE